MLSIYKNEGMQYCALTQEKSPDSSVLASLEMALGYLSLSGCRAEVSFKLRIICGNNIMNLVLEF